ncbi:EAL and HDOD domain-containing protein [Burkholderia glumae]|uniref:EAL domain-containing protein n=1 Tax=Burkholderia glumae TaxID=337 RepID=A0AAP9XVH8_BURGL|nr:EAL domain-containing protein [Burkholderia glumae]ACR32274.1 Diguanylate phosphodiesterase [Burkholderia glumae BGR1]AJY64797.1 EAL domain protein [Burkholderia glumae LMG 2196 = ATCC 33617]KHJ61733.1 diguanylate phosphodiesterase [Burkholderia glumae]MCM2484535.1 EAL domain-containing protein [Burkholderia glumae]MCM2494915.1 EAL domain-containing protein [Burkholderia glumae]
MTQTQNSDTSLGDGLAIFAKQSIVDRDGKLYGHELLFRGQTGTAAAITDDVRATTCVLEAAVGHVGLHHVSPTGMFFLNCSDAFLMSPTIHVLPAHRFVLEILETSAMDRRLLRRCEQLRAMGFSIALDDVRAVSPKLMDALPLMDIVKVDWPFIEARERDLLVEVVVNAGKIALAEKIETYADRDRALQAGCDLLQGFFFSRPRIVATRKLPPDFDVIARVLQAILDEENLADLSIKIEQCPKLCIQLLHLANNCAATKQSRARISSISQAASLAGTNMLLTWCALQLYQGGADVLTDPLADLARLRAEQMSDLQAAEGAPANAITKARLVGLLSLLHVSQGVPAAELWRPIALDAEIKRALILQEGPLGAALASVIELERAF